MSELEKSEDNKDVLSSIRRLVADEPKAKTEKNSVSPASDGGNTHILKQPIAPQIAPYEPTKRLASFVETMNASIAKITNDSEITDLETILQSKSDATAEEPSASEFTSDPEKPFILRSEFIAKKADDKSSTATIKETTADKNHDHVDAEETLNDDIDADAEEILLPDNVEDDELANAQKNVDNAEEIVHSINEEIIREMVGEYVRAELQGELGDRITRNVRKLVRREIHQALANREFD